MTNTTTTPAIVRYPCGNTGCGAPVHRPGIYRLCEACRSVDPAEFSQPLVDYIDAHTARLNTTTTTSNDARTIATDRAEDEPCQTGTPGCCIDHSADDGSCETW